MSSSGCSNFGAITICKPVISSSLQQFFGLCILQYHHRRRMLTTSSGYDVFHVGAVKGVESLYRPMCSTTYISCPFDSIAPASKDRREYVPRRNTIRPGAQKNRLRPFDSKLEIGASSSAICRKDGSAQTRATLKRASHIWLLPCFTTAPSGLFARRRGFLSHTVTLASTDDVKLSVPTASLPTC